MILPARNLVTIDRDGFELVLWRFWRGRYVKKVVRQIAVGAEGHDTPAGLYFVEWKTITPDWKAPDSEWVQPPEKRGQIFKFGDPQNPFAGGFMSIFREDGIGIHGTSFPPRLGERVSHGCIRMDTAQFVDLYGKVPIGTPVFIY